MGLYRLRDDVPINLPSSYKEETLRLRNKLLMFRFRNLQRLQASEELVDRSIEPRLNQIFVPLLSIITDEDTREELREVARQYNREMIAERGLDTEAQLLEVIRDMLTSGQRSRLTIMEITSRFVGRHGEDYERKVTTKWVGTLLRKKLKLRTQKSHGVFGIPLSEEPKLERLYEKYGLTREPLEPDPTGNNQ